MSEAIAAAIPLAANLVIKGPGRFKGISVAETAGAAAYVKLYDNASAGSGTILGAYKLAANGSTDVSLNSPVFFTAGIYAVISGTVEGSVRV